MLAAILDTSEPGDNTALLMTFVDAAIEVLKREGKPLPVKRLAELAVKNNLLSVVGRDPASTMQDRLDDVFERHGGHHPDLVRVSGDTFGLKAYPAPGTMPPVESAAAHGSDGARNGQAQPASGAAAAAGEGKSRRRRRRGGRKGEAPAGAADGKAGESDAAEDDNDESGADAGGVTAGDGASATAAEGAGPSARVAASAAAREVAGVGVAAASAKTIDATGEAKADGDTTVAAKPGTPAAGEEPRRRRRRGGRGRRRRGEGAATANPGSATANGADDDDDEDEDTSTQAAAPSDDAASGDESMGAGVAALSARTDANEHPASPPILAVLPDEAQAAGTSSPDVDGGVESNVESESAAGESDGEAAAAGEGDDSDDLYDQESAELEADMDHDSGPVLAPAHGVEDLTRSDEDRAVRPEIMGSGREDRHRRDRHRRDRKGHKEGDRARPGQRPEAGRSDGPRSEAGHRGEPHARDAARPEHKPEHRSEHKPEHKSDAPATAGALAPPPRPGEVRALVDAVLEVLRSSDGRPLHVRHIVEAALKRRLVDARVAPNELVRLARVALARELRDRESEGLRPRVRSLGAGHFAPLATKLDPDLAAVEGELADRAARLRDATKAALRRRLGRMTPPAFEALARALCEKLGIAGLELIRRGEGVAYYGGQRPSGLGTVKTLVAVRPGDVEINRRAVGELRAGLAAKGCDEGLLFSAGRAGSEAMTELRAGSGVTAYDGVALAQLLVRHGLGVKRQMLPVDYLDLEFFTELTEG